MIRLRSLTSISLNRVQSTLRPSGVINMVPPDHDKLSLVAAEFVDGGRRATKCK